MSGDAPQLYNGNTTFTFTFLHFRVKYTIKERMDILGILAVLITDSVLLCTDRSFFLKGGRN